MEFTGRARAVFAVTFLTLGVVLAVGFASVSPGDWPFAAGAKVAEVRNLTGPFGSFLSWTAIELFGRVFAWLLPLALLVLAINAAGALSMMRRWVFKALILSVLLSAVFFVTPITRDIGALHGRIGSNLGSALAAVFGEFGSTIVLVASILLLALGELGHLGRWSWKAVRAVGNPGALVRPFSAVTGRMRDRAGAYWTAVTERDDAEEEWVDRADGPEIHAPGTDPVEAEPASAAVVADGWEDPAAAVRPARAQQLEITQLETRRRAASASKAKLLKPGEKLKPLSKATLPPVSMLDAGGPEINSVTRDDLKNWSSILEEKLRQFGVEGKVTSVHHGPVVTTFEWEPAPGVRIKDITSRADDLALAMRARSLRMIAPIPGRAAVGIEIPNPESRMVFFRNVLEDIPQKDRMRGVMIGMGVDVVGKSFNMNLCDAPHLLIAGTTGSGKSVCLNCILASILFQYRPEDVRLLLVDPKVVEFSVYNGIPHLLHPVITDPKEAAKALEYLVREMQRRNELFRRHGVRNIESYNAKVARGGKVIADGEPMERLPYVVVVIDEMGDLALAKGFDIETLLARLAQMARAAGIHMVLATQRPSVDVIVGKTKANFPTRIAFRVATKVDSRTILDVMGADKLLGRGDMLYTDARNPMPVRLHGSWISEKEVEQLITHWKAYEFEDQNLDLTGGRTGPGEAGGDFDPLFDDARAIVFQYKQGSTSLLQRKLHVGYSRAARLLDQLETAGFVGPPEGSKAREVYMDASGDGGAA